MPKRRANSKDVYAKAELLASGKLSFSAQVLMRTRRGSLRAGYMNKLGRLERKVAQQVRSESCGPRTKDWLRGY
jgi:hypothetical protein